MWIQRIGILLLLMSAWIPIRFSYSASPRSPMVVVDWSPSVREDPGKRRWVLRQVQRIQKLSLKIPVYAFSDTLVPWEERSLLEGRDQTLWPLSGLDPTRPVVWITDGLVPPPRGSEHVPTLRALIPDSLYATARIQWLDPPGPGRRWTRIHLNQPVDSLTVFLDQRLLTRWEAPRPGTLEVVLPVLDAGVHELRVTAPAETLSARWEEPGQLWTAGVVFRAPRDGIGRLRQLLELAGWQVRTFWIRSADTLALTPHGTQAVHNLPAVDAAWFWSRGLMVPSPVHVWMVPFQGISPEVRLRDTLGEALLGVFSGDTSGYIWMWQPFAERSRAQPDHALQAVRRVSAFLRARIPRVRWVALDTVRQTPGPVRYMLEVTPPLPVMVISPAELSCIMMGQGLYRCSLDLQEDTLSVPVHLRIGSRRWTFTFHAHQEREQGTPRWDVNMIHQWVEATGGESDTPDHLPEALAPLPRKANVSLDHPLVLVLILGWLVGVWVQEQKG